MSLLWATDSEGRVFTLPTLGQTWSLAPYNGIDIKRVSALEECIWAIGGDHKIYVLIPHQEVPIRVREVAYENQRWNPVEGFTSRLLPTDRPSWSSKDGLTARYKDTILLPTTNWKWEEDWYVETNLKGHPLAAEGWTWSVDFPMAYGPESHWNSMVRRRKWIRHRCYVNMDIWSPVPSIYDDPVQEPFIDVAIGGLEIPRAENDYVCVWAVTVLGRVVFRQGVNRYSPEGLKWVHIPTPGGFEVHQISVGPTGLVWAICWDGSALVRTNVTRENIQGLNWVTVPAPPGLHRLLQISVGLNVVWATSTDGKVWFRKGVKGLLSGTEDSFAFGNGWVEMVGEMSVVSVGKNDQVLALGREDSNLYFRSGVLPADLSGKTWKLLRLPNKSAKPILEGFSSRNTSRSSSYSSLHWAASNDISTVSNDYHPTNLHHFKEDESLSMEKLILCKKTGFATFTRQSSFSSNTSETICDFESHSPAPSLISMEATPYSSSAPTNTLIMDDVTPQNSLSEDNLHKKTEEMEFQLCMGTNTSIMSDVTPQNSLSEVYLHKKPEEMEFQSYMGEPGGSSQRQFWGEDNYNPVDTTFLQPASACWVWFSAGACDIDGTAPPNQWFLSSGEIGSKVASINAPWRQKIFESFQERSRKEVLDYQHLYPDAIEKRAWVKSGRCLFWTENKTWADGMMELQKQSSSSSDSSSANEDRDVEWATLTCKLGKRKFVINLCDILCIANLSNAFKPVLGLHVAGKPLVQLAFMSNADLEDWMATLNAACSDLGLFNVTERISSLWMSMSNGEVYIVDGTNSNLDQLNPSKMFWRLLGGGHFRKIEASPLQIIWSLGFNNMCWVYTGGMGGGPFVGLVGRNKDIHPIVDAKSMYIYENQRWNPLTGFAARGLPTDRYMWSDKSGRHHCTKGNTKLPSVHWQWIGEWDIDYKTPGGVDKEGWQYASDFPRSYHGEKGFTDYVRRRRWVRRCKLTTTGPWVPSGTTRLLDVSIQVGYEDSHQSDIDPIAVWAIAVNGDALCRVGVTKKTPKGDHWIPVATEQPLQSISIGNGSCVWAIAKEGTAFYRHGIHPVTCPTGQVWFQIEAPQAGSPLKSLSIGSNSVFALDEDNKLWYRNEIVQMFPEGTSWKLVSEQVEAFSVGKDDQLWAVLESVHTSNGQLSGVICRRKGITKENKIGTSWETVFGGGTQFVSCRGISNAT